MRWLVVTVALLTLPATASGATFEVGATGGNSYVPEGLRVAVGDSVRWAATAGHPLEFDGENSGPYTSGTHQRLITSAGPIRFYCVAHGGSGGQGMSGRVTVGTANEPPIVAVAQETVAPRAGEVVVLRAIAGDPERIALDYEWDLDGDGTFEHANAAATVATSFATGGDHVVRARVTDDLDVTAVAQRTVVVAGSAAQPPATGPLTPLGPGSPPPRPTVVLGVARTVRLMTLRRRGLRLAVTASVASRAQVRLSGPRRRRVLASRSLAAARRTAITLQAPRAVRGSWRLDVTVTALASGEKRTITRRLHVR